MLILGKRSDLQLERLEFGQNEGGRQGAAIIVPTSGRPTKD